MIITIAIILSGLVALNFLLLIFSCNKNTKAKRQVVHPTLSRIEQNKKLTKAIPSTPLAATGS